MTETPTVPRPAMQLGLAGLIPFVVLSLSPLVLDAETAALARRGLAIYAAAILSFLGGCRWAFASAGLGEGPTMGALGRSVLPSIVGWAAAWLLPPSLAAGLFAVAFGVLYLEDAKAARAGAVPAWWPALRLPPSVVAMVALLVGMFV